MDTKSILQLIQINLQNESDSGSRIAVACLHPYLDYLN